MRRVEGQAGEAVVAGLEAREEMLELETDGMDASA